MEMKRKMLILNICRLENGIKISPEIYMHMQMYLNNEISFRKLLSYTKSITLDAHNFKSDFKHHLIYDIFI